MRKTCFFSPQVLLRYLMYAARTKFKAPDGISLLSFGGNLQMS
jgi:hypothetical protein